MEKVKPLNKIRPEEKEEIIESKLALQVLISYNVNEMIDWNTENRYESI
ncbi:MAG: hypothetical protein HFI76_09470 [Lachnospiraceae bacterium]|nr:hypothetical protein [Lachnospiraceae bacterium]